MKLAGKLLIPLFIMLALLSCTGSAAAKSSGGYHKVEGYHRKDGTYVRPHYRSNPDGIKSNNFSETGKPTWMRAEERSGTSSGSSTPISFPSWSGESIVVFLFIVTVIVVAICWVVATSEEKDPVPTLSYGTPPPLPRRRGSRSRTTRRRRNF